jgi:hypothetical protein
LLQPVESIYTETPKQLIRKDDASRLHWLGFGRRLGLPELGALLKFLIQNRVIEKPNARIQLARAALVYFNLRLDEHNAKLLASYFHDDPSIEDHMKFFHHILSKNIHG